MNIVSTILALQPLLEHAHQDLVAVVALGRLGVGVDDEGVRYLETVGQVKVYPGWAPCKR